MNSEQVVKAKYPDARDLKIGVLTDAWYRETLIYVVTCGGVQLSEPRGLFREAAWADAARRINHE